MPGPVLPPVTPPTPDVTAEDILQATRVICNDAGLSLAGKILADNQPYTFTMLQTCYEDMQDRLISKGVDTYKKYWVVTGLTAITVNDPGVDVILEYGGYFDGTTLQPSPTLPSDLLKPVELWERQHGATSAWIPMRQVSDSISSRPQNLRFGVWDWETDQLTLPGATQANDIRIKGLLAAPALTGPSSPVLIPRCKIALANLLAEMAAKSRGGTEMAAVFAKDAEMAIERIANRTAIKEQYANFQRKPFRNRSRNSRGR
jgi:hypothetical protein